MLHLPQNEQRCWEEEMGTEDERRINKWEFILRVINENLKQHNVL